VVLGIKVNDVEGEYFPRFETSDPLAPLLFNFIVDVFSKMLTKGFCRGLIKSLCSELIPGGVISSKNADNILVFLQKHGRTSVNFKWILTCFGKYLG
jgi:hypothetical protein